MGSGCSSGGLGGDRCLRCVPEATAGHLQSLSLSVPASLLSYHHCQELSDAFSPDKAEALSLNPPCLQSESPEAPSREQAPTHLAGSQVPRQSTLLQQLKVEQTQGGGCGSYP